MAALAGCAQGPLLTERQYGHCSNLRVNPYEPCVAMKGLEYRGGNRTKAGGVKMHSTNNACIRGSRGWHKVGVSVWAACLCFALPLTCFGGREPEEWDDLPQAVSMSFSQLSVGLTTSSGKYFVLDRASNELHEFDKNRFLREMGGATGVMAAEVVHDTGTESVVALRTSTGKALITQNAYCGEGEKNRHGLWLDRISVRDHVDPCSSISAAEIVDDQLWLGTRFDGEYGDYPAQGIVVQSLATGRLIKRLTTKQGLTGDLVRTIRLDPYGKTIWVATNRGINEIDLEFRVARSLFFYQDLDPQTGAPTVSLTPSWRTSNPLATLFKQLGVRHATEFYKAAIQIPPAVRQRFFDDLNDGSYAPVNARSVEESFAPKEANVLVPFFIEAARSPTEGSRANALAYICSFNDQRVLDFLVEESKALRPPAEMFIPKCVGKYMRFGLMGGLQQRAQISAMLKQEEEALARARSPSTPANFQVIAETAKSLKQLGDRRGMDLINDYFRNSEGGSLNVSLYEYLGQQLVYEDEIAPAMLEGLKKIHSSYAARGCQFFDMRWQFMPRRFDARYAEAILISIDSRAPGQSYRAGEDDCVEAFKSQLANDAVRRAFLSDVYPKLTSAQKTLADELWKRPAN